MKQIKMQSVFSQKHPSRNTEMAKYVAIFPRSIFFAAEVQLCDCDLKEKRKQILCIIHVALNAHHLILTFINHWKATLFPKLLMDKILQPIVTLIITTIK